jgi:hypothetical protein
MHKLCFRANWNSPEKKYLFGPYFPGKNPGQMALDNSKDIPQAEKDLSLKQQRP